MADVINYGVPHQNIVAITCEECGKQAGGKFLEQGVEEPVSVGDNTEGS